MINIASVENDKKESISGKKTKNKKLLLFCAYCEEEYLTFVPFKFLEISHQTIDSKQNNHSICCFSRQHPYELHRAGAQFW